MGIIETQSSSSRSPRPVGAARRLWSLFAVLALLQAMDLATTYVALAKGGREGNPVLRDLLFSPAAPLLKAIALVVLAILIVLSTNRHRHAPASLLTVTRWIVFIYIGIVANNIIVVRRLH